jgi:hypothetical protein
MLSKYLHISLLTLLTLASLLSRAQKVDNIYFNLYTDSLKKGTHNYINVDGKLSNGGWLPLTVQQLNFSATAGKWEGNSLYIDPSFSEEKVTITATLKENPTITKSIVIYIKTKDLGLTLKTQEELQKEMETLPPKKRKKKRS